jgi:5-methylcytosine-specific restriction enzyme subunit McrC
VRGTVSRHEFESVLVGGDDGLREDELDYLARLRRGGPAFYTEERREGRWYCRFAGFAGAIALPSGRTLEILPKISGTAEAANRALIMRMLAATGLAPSIEHELAVYAGSPHLIEAYLRVATDLAARYLRRGLVHAYRRTDLRLPVIRGRLRLGAQLARLPERVDAHLLSADVFTADTAANRAVKAGVGRIERLSRVIDTRARCRELLARLDAVGDPPAGPARSAALFEGLILDRRHAHLAPLLRVLELIVTGRGSATAAGPEAPGPAWLFAMEQLFEAYVAAGLRRVATGVEVAVQGPVRPLAVGGGFPQRPDLVVLVEGRPMLVLDAKWKLLDRGLADVDAADLRQVYAYARIYGVERAVLVYPGTADPGCLREDFTVNDGSGIRLSVCQLPLAEGAAGELDRVLDELMGDIGSGTDQARRVVVQTACGGAPA